MCRTELAIIGSLEHTILSREHYDKIQHAYMKYGSEIMVYNLDAIYVKLGFSHDAVRVLGHEEYLDSLDRLRVLLASVLMTNTMS